MRQSSSAGWERLRDLAAEALRCLAQAVAVCDPEPLASGAMVAGTRISAELQSRTVPGVRVFDLHHEQARPGAGTRGWAPTLAPTHLDALALAYEEQLERFLDLCAVELSVRPLAGEIARTTKQPNGLENSVFPQLHEEARRIALALDEREPREHARVRRARTRRTSRDASRDRPDGTWRAA